MKMKFPIIVLCFATAIALISCGGQTSEPPSEYTVMPDTVASIETTPSAHDSTVSAVAPTPVHAVPMRLQKRSARLAYSYCSEMKRNESSDVNVYVSVVNPASVVVDTLMKIVAAQHNPQTGKVDKDSVVSTNILLYKRIKIELIDPDSAFRIKQVYGEPWQEVDSSADTRWRWSVVPLTDAKQAKLILKVVAETPEGTVKDIDDRTFYVKVKLAPPTQMVRSWWSYLQDNPALVVTVILIPLIAFFGKRYFDRKAKK